MIEAKYIEALNLSIKMREKDPTLKIILHPLTNYPYPATKEEATIYVWGQGKSVRGTFSERQSKTSKLW